MEQCNLNEIEVMSNLDDNAIWMKIGKSFHIIVIVIIDYHPL
jgi:hypothetical protein